MINWVPSAELPPLASRHLPDCGLTREPFAPGFQFCPPLPLHVDSCTRLPLAVPPPAIPRHLLSARRVLPLTVHCWLAPPWQVHSWIFVPSAELPPLTSTHLPAAPVIGPACGVVPPDSLIRMLRNDTSSP